ncbi:MAG: hypothetical protein M0023_14605 [Desulfobacteraceae bacterium]|nr:hypothetical protein [Desulfobacteraceae bacterium]
MKLLITSPAKTLNKAHLKQSLKREDIDKFKRNLTRLFERVGEASESEEHLKNIVIEFLKDTWYKDTNEVNTAGRNGTGLWRSADL